VGKPKVLNLFKWKHEPYELFYKDHENQVVYYVRSVVTELQPILRLKRQKISVFSFKCWVLIKIVHIFVISIKFWVGELDLKWNPWHGKKSEFLWTIVRRFSTIFEFFKRKRELYALFHEDSENRVVFDVRSVVTELQSILRLKKQKIADFSLKCWVLIKIIHIFVISIKFWVGELDLKWNPWHGQKSEFLWTIVRRFSTIFEFFKRKRELYALFHEDSENRVLFDVRSVVTELQSILRLKKQKIADFSLKCWVLIKIIHIFVISIKFWVGELDLKWNPWHGQKSEFLWTIVRRFSTIFEFFKRKRELYALFHEDSENRVLFDVRSVVTELQSILRLKKQKIADFSLKCWVLIKIIHIFVISIKFWVGELDLKWNPWHGQKSEFLWTIVRRFSTIFEFFKRKRELYALFHEDSENRVSVGFLVKKERNN
jgi:hypothetical protein